jgi:hypothetical protein
VDFLARPKSKRRFVRFYPFRKPKEICEVNRMKEKEITRGKSYRIKVKGKDKEAKKG